MEIRLNETCQKLFYYLKRIYFEDESIVSIIIIDKQVIIIDNKFNKTSTYTDDINGINYGSINDRLYFDNAREIHNSEKKLNNSDVYFDLIDILYDQARYNTFNYLDSLYRRIKRSDEHFPLLNHRKRGFNLSIGNPYEI